MADPTTPITIETLIGEVQALAASRAAADAAHADTVAALNAVVVAQADATAKGAAQADAEAAEQGVFDQLLADLQAFKAGS